MEHRLPIIQDFMLMLSFWSRATDMNCHIPYKIRDINDKVIFEKRQIHTVLSIFFEDCLSGPTRMDLSQSIKILHLLKS